MASNRNRKQPNSPKHHDNRIFQSTSVVWTVCMCACYNIITQKSQCILTFSTRFNNVITGRIDFRTFYVLFHSLLPSLMMTITTTTMMTTITSTANIVRCFAFASYGISKISIQKCVVLLTTVNLFWTMDFFFNGIPIT